MGGCLSTKGEGGGDGDDSGTVQNKDKVFKFHNLSK